MKEDIIRPKIERLIKAIKEATKIAPEFQIDVERSIELENALKEFDIQNFLLMWDALKLSYRALTEGMKDIPFGNRDLECAKIRLAATHAIRKVWRGVKG